MTRIGRALRNLLRGKAEDRDLDRELRAYLTFAVDEHMRRGLTRQAAERAARLEFGGIDQVKESVRDARAGAALETMWRDVAYAARSLRKNPAFALAAIAIIGLGIGVNTAIFSVLNGIIFRELPLPDASRVVSLTQSVIGQARGVHGMGSFFSYAEYEAYRDRNQMLSGLLAYSPFVEASLGGDEPRQLVGTIATCNYFDVLGVHPALGRGFLPQDCAAPGSAAVIVIGNGLWRSAFGADPGIVGRTISVNRTPFVVIGVAPAEFSGTEPIATEFWAPLTMQKVLERGQDLLANPNMSWLAVLGRLRPEATLDRAAADLRLIASQIDGLQTGRRTALYVRRATIMPQIEERTFVFGIGGIVLGAVGLVLLVACANVANLLLARAAGRRREIAIRLAIGASRRRLVRQLLTESLVLAAIGGAAGSTIAIAATALVVRQIVSHMPTGYPALIIPVGGDMRVLGFAVGLTILTGLAFGLVPALRASRAELTAAMKDEGADRSDRTRSAGLLRHGLLAAQMAGSMVLLLAAGLLIRGLARSQTIDPGFATANVSVATFDLEAAGYDQARADVFRRLLMERVAALPGVDDVAQARVTPLNGSHIQTVFHGQDDRLVRLEFNSVTPAFFSMLRIPIVAGRAFSEEDCRVDRHVVVVSESAARGLWPGSNPIGQRLRQDAGKQTIDFEVVGVAKDAQVSRLSKTDSMYLYFPASPRLWTRLALMIHASIDYAAASSEIRTAFREIDPELPVTMAKLSDNFEVWRMPARIAAITSAVLGALAMVLAAIGMYGVVAYALSRRIHEIGIRIALGADGPDVIRLMLRQAMRPVFIGAALGMLIAAGASRLLADLLYGISPYDPVSFVGVPIFLATVALTAAYVPARRATRIDPIRALRHD
jgi:macrolide transport system ATP-binding/permease protein